MSDEPRDEATEARVEVLQAVVDRVISWQEAADAETVRKELDDALADSDVDVDTSVRDRIVAHIASEDAPHVDVRQFLS
jgi:hypothetical protein